MVKGRPKKTRVAVQVRTRVQSVTGVKLAVATFFLGISALAASAAVPLATKKSIQITTPIGVTMVNQSLPDQVQMIPQNSVGADGMPIMAVSLTVPTGETATLRKLVFNVIRATDSGWSGDLGGCGFARYSLTASDGTLLGLATRQAGLDSTVEFRLSSPLVISDSTTVQLRPLAFFPEIARTEVAQALHGCRLLPVLAASSLDLVGKNDQPLPVFGGPAYGSIVQVLLNQPTIGWTSNSPDVLVNPNLKTITLANVEIRNNTRAGQPLSVAGLPLVIRTNATAIDEVVLIWTPATASQPVFTQTLLPEEWRSTFTVPVYTPKNQAWMVPANSAVSYTLSINAKALQGQPGWYVCTSVPAEAELQWKLGNGADQASPVRLPEFCVVKA